MAALLRGKGREPVRPCLRPSCRQRLSPRSHSLRQLDVPRWMVAIYIFLPAGTNRSRHSFISITLCLTQQCKYFITSVDNGTGKHRLTLGLSSAKSLLHTVTATTVQLPPSHHALLLLVPFPTRRTLRPDQTRPPQD